MKKLAIVATSLVVLASSGVFTNAFAQEKTRAQVYQELIEAEQNGSQYITDASYPEVSPIYTEQVARLKAQHEATGMATNSNANGAAAVPTASTADSGKGMDPTGTSASGKHAAAPMEKDGHVCVGPASFCNLYAGS